MLGLAFFNRFEKSDDVMHLLLTGSHVNCCIPIHVHQS